MLAPARLLALGLPALLIAGALGSQYIGRLVPCEMCLWQRYPHYAAIVAAALAIALARSPLSRLLTMLAGLLILASGAIGAWQAGAEYRWWPGPSRCTGIATGHGADLLRAILAAPIVQCDVPQWTLFHVSLAGFNALFSLAGGMAVLALCFVRPR